LKQIQVVCAKKQQVVGRACRWRRNAIKIGRQNTANRRTLLETHLRCRGSIQHGIAVVSAKISADEGIGSAIEHVEGLVVPVRPYSHLGVIIEVRILKGVPVESAARI